MTDSIWVFSITNPSSPGTTWVQVNAGNEATARNRARRLLDEGEGVGERLNFPDAQGDTVST